MKVLSRRLQGRAATACPVEVVDLEDLTPNFESRLSALLPRHEKVLLDSWLQLIASQKHQSFGNAGPAQLEETARAFLNLLWRAIANKAGDDLTRSEWNGMHEFLTDVSRRGVEAGSSPSDVATFVLSFKQPLFGILRQEYQSDAQGLADETWTATILIDKLALEVTEAFQKTREEVIRRQQQELLELSTPVVQLWQGVLALPLIGTLDSARTQVVMQNLLEAIVSYGAEIAIIDITGVPTVDTLVAQRLLKTVAAARLMGADCIISGIRPQIAQTIVHLGVDLADVTTKATLADAFQIALRKGGFGITKSGNRIEA